MRSIRCAAAALLLALSTVAGPAATQAPEALALAKQGRAQLAGGAVEAARATLAEAIPALRDAYGAQHPFVAYALDDLAQAELASGLLDEALAHADSAVAVIRATRDPESAEHAALAANRAVILVRTGRLQEAEELLRAAHGTLERTLGPTQPRSVAAARNLANVLEEMERYDAAESVLRALLRQLNAAQALQPDLVANVRVDLATVLLRKEDIATAEAELATAMPVLEARQLEQPEDLALALETKARIALRASDLQAAEALLARADEVLPPTPSVARAQVWYARGYLQLTRRQAVEAEATYRDVLGLYEQLVGGAHPAMARVLHQLGQVYADLARPSESRRFFEQSIAASAKALGVESRAVAETRVEFAMLLTDQGEPGRAINEADTAIAIFNGFDEPPLLRRAFAFNAKGFALQAAGRLSQAREALVRGTDAIAALRGPESSDLPPGLLALAEIDLVNGRIDDAAARIARAYAILEKNGARTINGLGRALGARARVAQAAGRKEDALALARQATELVRARFNLAQGGLSQSMFGELRRARKLLELHLEVLGTADPTTGTSELFEVGQLPHLSGTAAAVGRMAARFAQGTGTLAALVRGRQDALEQWQALDQQLLEAVGGRAQHQATLRTRQREMEVRIDGLDRTLKDGFPGYADLTRPRPVTLAEVQAVLAPDEALLLQVTAADRTHLVLVRASGARYAATPMGAAQLTEHVRAVRASIDAEIDGSSSTTAFAAAEAHELYRGLLEPFAADLGTIRHLIVVPDQAMQSLPPQVLVASPPSGKSDRELDYLVRRLATSVVPSPGTLVALRRIARASGAAEPFAGFGNPQFGAKPSRPSRGPPSIDEFLDRGIQVDVSALRTRLAPLPESQAELEIISKELAGAPGALFFGARATEAVVKAAPLDRYRVVAFATHGLLATETAQFAGLAEPSLVLTPPDTPSALDNGLLMASEVAQLKLDADWIVLSACNTAADSGAPGSEGLSGLARAFFYAGSRSLLVTHWPVFTDAAVRLTTGTFGALARDPSIGRAEALRRATELLLDDPLWSHPAAWAPFVVVGEGGAPAPH